jgi:hypothetical protein
MGRLVGLVGEVVAVQPAREIDAAAAEAALAVPDDERTVLGSLVSSGSIL